MTEPSSGSSSSDGQSPLENEEAKGHIECQSEALGEIRAKSEHIMVTINKELDNLNLLD